MQLPSSLQQAIHDMIDSFGIQQLKDAREELTERYRQPSLHRHLMSTDAQRQSYVIARLPATYAAIYASLQAILKRAPQLSIRSVLDLGAGPGTAMWATCELFPEIDNITLIERDHSLVELGQRLAQASEHAAVRLATWKKEDLEQDIDFSSHDLVILSYSVGELDPQGMIRLIEKSWKAAKQLVVVIEPGTPAGFERIRIIRRQLIDGEAHLIAPCPHHLACPMAGGDWCHFSARVERSSLHRRLKEGTLGHEDEKFSYVAATKMPFSLPSSRVLSYPLRHSGHTVLKLCTIQGVQRPTISKKMGELYKLARKVEWGDQFPFDLYKQFINNE